MAKGGQHGGRNDVYNLLLLDRCGSTTMLPTAPPADGAMTSAWLFGASSSPSSNPTTGLSLPCPKHFRQTKLSTARYLGTHSCKCYNVLTASINANSSAWIATTSSGVQTDRNTPLRHADPNCECSCTGHNERALKQPHFSLHSQVMFLGFSLVLLDLVLLSFWCDKGAATRASLPDV